MARRTRIFTALFLAKWLALGLFIACRSHAADEAPKPSDFTKNERAVLETPPEADLERLFLLAQMAVEKDSFKVASARLSDGILVFRNRTGHFHGPKAATANQTIGQLAAMRSRLRRSQAIDRDQLQATARAAIVLVNSQ